jgi:hypothetical protein
MQKTITYSILLAIVFSLFGVTAAFAQTGGQPQTNLQRPFAIGKILSLGDGQFTLQKQDGEEVTILVNDQTRYRVIGAGQATFDDLVVGRWVAGYGRKDANGQPLARLMVMLAQDFDPGKLPDRRVAGLVKDVNSAAGSLTIETRLGADEVVAVDQNTRYRGEVQSLSDVETGMAVLAAVRELEDGSLLATNLIARSPVRRLAGKIVAIDADVQNLTVHTRSGEDVVIALDAATGFRSLFAQAKNLDQLKLGDVVIVSLEMQSDSTYLAKQVIALNPRLLVLRGLLRNR